MTKTSGLVDSHCHLDRFDEADRAIVLSNAVQAGVKEIVTIGTRLSQSLNVVSIANAGFPGLVIWCSVGTHPDHVEDEPALKPEQIVQSAVDPRVIGIGETGLDYVSSNTDREHQKTSFRAHIAAARLAGLPVIIHARGADDDVALILREESVIGPFKFLLHCFTSGEELAATGLELGGYLSFSGILTFPKSEELRQLARSVPPDRLLIETDAPFLAPVPKRGRRNEPAYVAHTADVLADLIGKDRDELGDLLLANFRRLFSKAT